MGVFKGYQPNIFRAVSGSLFSTAANWSRGYVPTGSDVATIADNCVIDVSRTIGSLVVRAPFTASISTGLTLHVKDVIDVKGHLSCSGTPNIISEARKNNVNSFSAASSSFLYSGSNQNVHAGPYFDLTIYGTGVKTATANTIVNRSLTVGTGIGIRGFLELGPYDLSVFGNTVVGANGDGVLSKSKFGNLLFVGSFANGNRSAAIRFSDGNPNVEFRSGIITTNSNPSSDTIQSGIGTWTFTSPTQTLQGWATFAPLNLDANIIISSSAVLNVFGGYNISNPINGAGPSSRLVMLANNLLTFTTAKALVNSMTTGSVDFTSSYNIIDIGGNYSATIPSQFNAFRDLSISGTGTKTLGTSSYVSGTLTINSPAVLELSSSNLYVSGTTQNPLGLLSKNGPGNITFNGMLVCNGGLIDFSGNPTVNFLGSAYLNNIVSPFNTGTGSWNFISSSQYIDVRFRNKDFSSSISIGPGLTLSLISTTNNAGIVAYRPINGQDATSKFVVGNNAYLYFANTSSLNNSFLTGSYDFNSSASNIWIAGDYIATIPARFSSSFYNLGITGTGVKTLGASSYVSNSLSIINNGYLNMSSSNLTINGNLTLGSPGIASMSLGIGNLYVSGTSTIWDFGKLITSASNNVVFNGLLDFRDYGVQGLLDFNLGSPNVEVRNGIITNQGNDPGPMKSGFGTWSFTTNNQSLTGPGSFTFTGSTIVSGAITLSNRARINIYQPINGTDLNSKFENNSGFLGVYTTSSLMTTGIIDVKTYPNTVFYAITDTNYIIPYQSYRSLQIGGGGVKSINQNTDVTGSLYVSTTNAYYTTFELSSYNLFVSGAASIINARLSKSGSGNIVFNDLLTLWDYGVTILDFSLGNPNVELRNGLYATNQGSVLGSINSGTGSWVFSTNNQSLYGVGVGYGVTIKAPITISGPITFTVNLSPTLSGSINGDNTNSKLLMAANSTIYYANSATPMSIGILDATSSLGTTFVYSSGSQNIRGGVYRNLTMNYGTKTLQGNISVLGTLSTGSGATLATINLNGFTLTNP